MNAAAPGRALTVRIITDEAEWDRLAPAWAELFARSGRASTPLRFGWLRQWWRVYGPVYGGGSGLRIVTLWRDDALIGVLPLYVSSPPGAVGLTTLRFLSTGEAEYEETCPDYLDLLCLPDEETACVGAVWNTLQEIDWDRLELLDLPHDSPLVRAEELPIGAGPVRVVQRGECWVANLAGGFDAYVGGRLAAKPRQQAHRLLRDAAKAGATLELATARDVNAFFDDLVTLHQARWTAVGKPGCFAAARFTAFHRALAQQGVPSGDVLLARLVHHGRPAAVLHGFVTGAKFDFYQSGVAADETGAIRSPGTLANLMLMRHLVERNITRYDFLRDPAAYKQRLATDAVPLVGLELWRPTVRATIHRTAGFVGRALRGSIRWTRS